MRSNKEYFDQTDLFGFFHWAYYYFTKYITSAKVYTRIEIELKKKVLDSIANTLKIHFLDGNVHKVDTVIDRICYDAKQDQVDVKETVKELGMVP